MNQISTQGYPAVEIAYSNASKNDCPFLKRKKAYRISDCSYGAFHVAGKGATDSPVSYAVESPQAEAVIDAVGVTDADADFVPVVEVGASDGRCFHPQNQICVFNA